MAKLNIILSVCLIAITLLSLTSAARNITYFDFRSAVGIAFPNTNQCTLGAASLLNNSGCPIVDFCRDNWVLIGNCKTTWSGTLDLPATYIFSGDSFPDNVTFVGPKKLSLVAGFRGRNQFVAIGFDTFNNLLSFFSNINTTCATSVDKSKLELAFFLTPNDRSCEVFNYQLLEKGITTVYSDFSQTQTVNEETAHIKQLPWLLQRALYYLSAFFNLFK